MNILDEFDFQELQVVKSIKDTCVSKKLDAYIVGGAIRDALLKVKVKDIDICVNANPLIIIENIPGVLKFDYHERFQTASLKFENGVKIDLIRSRSEKYYRFGDLPAVHPSDIMQDLYRRDFTINALAYDLKRDKIMDLYGGIQDIENKILRKIHKNSYEKDPTRIFRAVRYSSRYGFSIADEEEITACIDAGVLKTISSDRKIREMLLICSESQWKTSFKVLKKLNIVDLDLKKIGIENPLINYEDENLRLLNLVYSINNKSNINYFVHNSIMSPVLRKSIVYILENGKNFEKNLENAEENSYIFTCMDKITKYSMAYFAWNYKLKYKIYNYIFNLSECKLNVNGNYIKALGVSNGKTIGKILKYILKVKLDTGIEITAGSEEFEHVFEH